MSKRYYGWSGTILSIDLSSGQISKKPLPMELARNFLGQSGLQASLLYDLAPPDIRPLDPESPFLIGAGPLCGTMAPCSGRFSISFKSPLTGIFADSNCGGHFGPELKMAGYDLVQITGKADRPVYILIDNEKIHIRKAWHLWGSSTWQTEEAIQSEVGDRTFQIASIGPAGENMVRYAAVISNRSRAAGRCGPGAVMGSKNLKAMAVRGDLGLRIYDPAEFQKACEEAKQAIIQDPLYPQASTLGTACITGMAQHLGFLPTRNFRASTFEGAHSLYGDTLEKKHMLRHKGCFNCPVSCGKYCSVQEGRYAGTEGEGPEYESISAFGSKLGNDHLPSIIRANSLCNQLGLDTISTGNTLAWLMECQERGILDEHSIGINIKFGDHHTALTLIESIAKREGPGDLLAEGAPAASRILGGEELVVHNKGLDYPAVDVRGTKGMALAFAVSPRGGDHLKGLPMMEIAPDLYSEELQQELNIIPGQQYWLQYSTKPELIRWHEDWHCVVDSLGLCKLEGIALKPLFPRHFLRLVNAATGLDLELNQLRRAGERIWNLERLFNIREGMGKEDDLPPQRILREPIATGPARGETLDPQIFRSMLREYYLQRGWDPETGSPTPEKLSELCLYEQGL